MWVTLLSGITRNKKLLTRNVRGVGDENVRAPIAKTADCESDSLYKPLQRAESTEHIEIETERANSEWCRREESSESLCGSRQPALPN